MYVAQLLELKKKNVLYMFEIIFISYIYYYLIVIVIFTWQIKRLNIMLEHFFE